MPDKKNLSWDDVGRLARNVADRILREARRPSVSSLPIYPVPRGGIFAAQAVCAAIMELDERRTYPTIVDDPNEALCIVDDIIDSGATRDHYAAMDLAQFANQRFYALLDQSSNPSPHTWYVFPWERMSQELGVEDNITRIIQFIGDNPRRPGLLETPKRVAKSFAELYSGYRTDVPSLFKVFDEQASDEMVLLRDIEFYSMCEHHMIPFHGVAHVAYIPQGGKVLGVSKMARVVDAFAHRLQIQERIGTSVTEAMDKHLSPLGSACVIEAKHLCMCARGVGKQGSVMVTSSLTGRFRDEPSTRSEFFSLVNHGNRRV